MFYEGPPTANGLPHNGHVLTRVIKDLFPRYKTMRGYHVPRKAGWDTHGLPVEVEVEKELRIHGKAAIEQYGVEPFVAEVHRVASSATRASGSTLTERVALLGRPARTRTSPTTSSYVESVWWALSRALQEGAPLPGAQGRLVVGAGRDGAVSSGEVGLGYKEVDDPSAYVAFPLVDKLDGEATSLLVWTTTPWTLPSNMYAAVNPAFDYVVVAREGRGALRRRRRRSSTRSRRSSGASSRSRGTPVKGAALVGIEYRRRSRRLRRARAHDCEAGAHDAIWRVLAADFVTLDAGTGIVHIAPAFGEDDYVPTAA